MTIKLSEVRYVWCVIGIRSDKTAWFSCGGGKQWRQVFGNATFGTRKEARAWAKELAPHVNSRLYAVRAKVTMRVVE